MRRGQIWLVNFDPSYGHEYQKIRPALVIQSNHYIPQSNLLTVIPISSITSKQGQLDVLIKKDSQNRLFKDSLVKINQISSFDKRRFIKLIGIVNKETIKKVDRNILRYIGL